MSTFFSLGQSIPVRIFKASDPINVASTASMEVCAVAVSDNGQASLLCVYTTGVEENITHTFHVVIRDQLNGYVFWRSLQNFSMAESDKCGHQFYPTINSLFKRFAPTPTPKVKKPA